jgi:hypothetical protein
VIRPLPRAFLAVATLLLGLWAQTARQLDTTHIHVVCPQHGELIEQVHTKGPAHAEIGVATLAAHDQGCVLGTWGPADPVTTLPTPVALHTPDSVDAPAPLLAATDGVARAPLLNAPKTSPPGA